MRIFDNVVQNPADYNFEIERLGPCKIPSPIRNPVFVAEDARMLLTSDTAILKRCIEKGLPLPSFEVSGPHEKIFHDPAWSRAAILTAGGLCPGLNHVIKGLVEILSFDYGIRTIYGIRYGYRGLAARHSLTPMLLDTEVVDTIHTLGGTILGSSRGQQDTSEMVDTLRRMNINLLFCIGGDGSLRAARDLAIECRKRKLAISIVGIPKTIDNDLNFVGRSFGFETAVTATSPVIESAHMEAKGTINGIGLIKLMGRDSGFITAYATVANPVVNFCLIPEDPFTMEGENGLLKALERRLNYKSHAVIVVAEGAGQELIKGEEQTRDASGNLRKKDIGEFLRQQFEAHFKKLGTEISIKYFDPSYSIRSIPAVGADAIRCYMLARGAVHAAMAGRTNCVVGNLHDGAANTLVPIELAAFERQRVDLHGDLWRAVLDATCQGDYFYPSNRPSNAPP
ncbi:MAG: ATP-dependent 6-phosphofructokinase [Lentisphaerae bacterium]|jgi:6-phosphofructokinase 1|nr:ATP-dependent 6-phosphofructokinase [Lentisphaerota bacterium]